RTVSGAVRAAAELLDLAGQDAKAITEERDAEEREHALRSLGVEPGGTVPPALRAQLRAMEEDQKRRATRGLRDGIDRILVDLLSLYRDLLLLQLGVELEPVNLAMQDRLHDASPARTPGGTLGTIDANAPARKRVGGNGAPAPPPEAIAGRGGRWRAGGRGGVRWSPSRWC